MCCAGLVYECDCRQFADMRGLHVSQALGLSFVCLSSSEPTAEVRKFQLLNSGSVLHQHRDLQSQLQGKPCCLLQGSRAGCCPASNAQLAVAGSPCNPYSTLRTKRFCPDSVQSHGLYDTTFQWLCKFTPVTFIMEQVPGFDLPDASGSNDTPLKRLRGRGTQGPGVQEVFAQLFWCCFEMKYH